MEKSLDIIIVNRLGLLKILSIKDFKINELYKKCGFKKAENFNKQTEWTVKFDGKIYFIQVFAKTDGRANYENKYDFPPPIDKTLFYGSCAIVCQMKKDNVNKCYVNLNITLWNKFYEKLFGGFYSLDTEIDDDEDSYTEEDLSIKNKTKQGYLKDGFVVDDDENTTDSEESEYYEEEKNNKHKKTEYNDSEDKFTIEDIGSELSEESYHYK
jgi:hypothetical protein